MNEQNYQMILEFLHQYGGKQYKRQDKCTSDDERAFMVSGYKSGQEARAGFTRIADSVAEEHGLLYDRITPWQNSDALRPTPASRSPTAPASSSSTCCCSPSSKPPVASVSSAVYHTTED